MKRLVCLTHRSCNWQRFQCVNPLTPGHNHTLVSDHLTAHVSPPHQVLFVMMLLRSTSQQRLWQMPRYHNSRKWLTTTSTRSILIKNQFEGRENECPRQVCNAEDSPVRVVQHRAHERFTRTGRCWYSTCSSPRRCTIRVPSLGHEYFRMLISASRRIIWILKKRHAVTRGDRKGTEDCESLFRKKNKTETQCELNLKTTEALKPPLSALPAQHGAGLISLRYRSLIQTCRCCFCVTRHISSAQTQINSPSKLITIPKSDMWFFFFFFFPLREQKVRNIPLWLMHHLLPELRLSSLQCRITTPAMSSPPNPPILLLATFSRVVGLIWRCQESSPLGKHIKDSERESVFS